MFCQKCGKQIPDNSSFCVYCGAPTNAAPAQNTGTTPNASVNFQQTMQNIQSNQNVQAAQKSLKSGWSAIVTVLKDPTAEVTLGNGEMIVILVIAALAHMLFMIFGCTGLFNTLKKLAGSYSSLTGSAGVGFNTSVLWSLLFGIIMVAVVVAIYVCSHCVEEKSFANFRSYLPGACIGMILPSVFMLAAGVFSAGSLKFGAVLVLLAIVAFLVYMLKSFHKTNQYLIIVYAGVSILVMLFVGFQMTKSTLMDSSVTSTGLGEMKISEIIEKAGGLGSILNLY